MSALKPARRRSGFQQGSGCYTCATCGRKTRNTGQSLSSELCPQCWDLAGLENEVSDGHQTLEEALPEARRLLAEIRSKGGDPDESFAQFVPEKCGRCGRPWAVCKGTTGTDACRVQPFNPPGK